jgi:hypothetical protein
MSNKHGWTMGPQMPGMPGTEANGAGGDRAENGLKSTVHGASDRVIPAARRSRRLTLDPR